MPVIVKATWVTDPVKTWVPNAKRWAQHVHQVIGAHIQARMPDIDEWMQINAPFQDITGAARRSLHTDLEDALTGYILRFMYATPIRYWVYLEYDHQGKFAILEPSVQYWGPILLSELRAMLK